jgi:hypothetical protein
MLEGDRKDNITNRSSNRSFGLVMSAFFLLVGLAPLISGREFRLWALLLAGAFAVLALFFAKVLKPLNTLWFKLGLLLHKIVSPLVLGIMFYVILTPIALILRIFSVDLLKLKLDSELATYWNERTPPGPAPDSMDNPF